MKTIPVLVEKPKFEYVPSRSWEGRYTLQCGSFWELEGEYPLPEGAEPHTEKQNCFIVVGTLSHSENRMMRCWGETPPEGACKKVYKAILPYTYENKTKQNPTPEIWFCGIL